MLYATPAVPAVKGLVVVIDGVPAPTTIFKAIVENSELLPVTFTVKLLVAAAVGVPVIVPALFMLNPPGKLPELIDQV